MLPKVINRNKSILKMQSNLHESSDDQKPNMKKKKSARFEKPIEGLN